MIKVANNLLNICNRTLIAKWASANPLATNHPFNIHLPNGESPQFYYSYGNSPATSLNPELLPALMNDDFFLASPEEFAAANNTNIAMKREQGKNMQKYMYPPRGPGYNLQVGDYVRTMPSMSMRYDRFLRRHLNTPEPYNIRRR